MKLKKILTLMCCAVLLVCISVGATLAYLQDESDTVTNTFTVGKVELTLDEAKVDVYGVVDATATSRVTENTYKLIPGHNYVKDPTIHVSADSEKSYVFVKLNNEIAAIEAKGDTTIAAQMTANKWTVVDADNGVYAYETAVEGGTNLPVFATFTVAGDAAIETYVGKTVTLIGYAVQADGFANAAAAWAATYGAPAAN